MSEGSVITICLFLLVQTGALIWHSAVLSTKVGFLEKTVLENSSDIKALMFAKHNEKEGGNQS